MNQLQDEQIRSHNSQNLRVYLFYRVILSGLLLIMFYTNIAPNALGTAKPGMYQYASLAYFLITVISIVAFPVSQLVHSKRRIHFLFLTDVLAQLVLIHSSNGMDSGLGYLLIITMAMVNIFVRGQFAYAYAATSSIALILDNLYLHQYSSDLGRIMFSSGTLGVLLFATTIALQYFTDRIRTTTRETEAKSLHIRNLQEIAQNIVTRMQTGVIVVDNELKIELMNASAKQMLDIPASSQVYGQYLANYRELVPVLKSWEGIIEKNEATILKFRPGYEIRVNIAHLETGGLPKNIFYLEDYASIKQHAQQLKLASLGQLAARIAHEIRNPLGAMSHAAQLLQESETLSTTERRMVEIMLKNSERVNDIIENTLSLSRRKEPQLQQINLADWLPKFVDETQIKQRKNIHIKLNNEVLLTKFDPTHLRQILSNIIDNGLRYSEKKHGEPWLEIEASLQLSDDKPFVEIRDNGKGIPREKIAEIYEPFYTTNEKGSGLGLYICKELCEINHATLHYHRNQYDLSCFTINFSHHQRMR